MPDSTSPHLTPEELEIQACPFCGSLAFLHEHERIFNGNDGYRVECEGTCHSMTCYWHTREQAASAWNRRDSLSAARRELAEAKRNVDYWKYRAHGFDHEKAQVLAAPPAQQEPGK